MPAIYQFPTAVAMTSIAQNYLVDMTLNDPVFNLIFPVKNRDTDLLLWEVESNYQGLMALRGLGGPPQRRNVVPITQNLERPGAFGEFDTIDEIFLTQVGRGIPMTLLAPVSVEDQVRRIVKQLMIAYINRMKQMCWTLANTGTLSIPLSTGGTGYTQAYTPQAFTANPLWSTTSTAHPLQDLRSLQPSYGFGTSNHFRGTSWALANSQTWNLVFANTNAADFGGRRTPGGGTLEGVSGYEYIQLREQIPQLVTFDDGYYDDSGSFHLSLPYGTVLVVGWRPDGEKPGEFQLTRNANNPDNAPGVYSKVIDKTQGPREEIPPKIEVHAGFNGGLTIMRPSQLVVITVA